MNTKEDMETAKSQAAWTAAYELAHVAQSHGDGFDWPGLCRAMFAAGQANALYRVTDLVDSLHDKAKKRAEKTSGDSHGT